MSKLTTTLDAALAHDAVFTERIGVTNGFSSKLKWAQIFSLSTLAMLFFTPDTGHHNWIRSAAIATLAGATCGRVWNAAIRNSSKIDSITFCALFDDVDSIKPQEKKNVPDIVESTLPADLKMTDTAAQEIPETLTISQDTVVTYHNQLNDRIKVSQETREDFLKWGVLSAAGAAVFGTMAEIPAGEVNWGLYILEASTILHSSVIAMTLYGEKYARTERDSLYNLFPDFDFPNKEKKVSFDVTKERRLVPLPFPLSKFKIPTTHYNITPRVHD